MKWYPQALCAAAVAAQLAQGKQEAGMRCGVGRIHALTVWLGRGPKRSLALGAMIHDNADLRY